MIFLKDIEELLPEKVINNDFFGEKEVRNVNKMFSGTNERRHWDKGELASDHLSKAVNIILERNNLDPKTDIDMILTNVSIPDEPFTGCGAVINKKIHGKVEFIYDMQNSGCISFIYLVDLAHTFMKANKIKTALVCVSQTAGGRIFGQEDTRQLAQSAIPGDGCAVALLIMKEKIGGMHVRKQVAYHLMKKKQV
jgi:3-oxoacyl-[acyl-carrier-protein] synthase-3